MLEFKIVMFATSHISSYSTLAAEINRRYCEKHGYGFSFEQYDEVELAASTEKVKVLQRHLGSANYLLWIDADACVIDYSQTLHKFCDNGNDFVTAGHEMGFDLQGRHLPMRIGNVPCGVNGGVMMFRNSQWSKRFLELWWDRCVQSHKNGDAFYEQGPLQQMLLENLLDIQSHTNLVVPCRLLNRGDDKGVDTCNFILHLWGTSTEHRQSIFSDVVQGRRPDIAVAMPSFNVHY